MMLFAVESQQRDPGLSRSSAENNDSESTGAEVF